MALGNTAVRVFVLYILKHVDGVCLIVTSAAEKHFNLNTTMGHIISAFLTSESGTFTAKTNTQNLGFTSLKALEG